MNSTKKRLCINGAVNWAGSLAQIVAVFVVSPILVHGLGDERYGVWALVESVLAYLTLFDLGIGAAVVRYIAKFEGQDQTDELNKTFSASLVLFAMAGLGVLAVAALILWPLWQWVPVPSRFRHEAWWQLAILSFNLAVGLPLGVFTAVLDGLQRYVPKALVRIVTLIVRSVALVIVVQQGGGLLQVALAVTVVGLIEHAVMGLLTVIYLPTLRFAPRQVDRTTMQSIFGYSCNAFLAMIAGRMSFQTDSIVIGSFLPLAQITFFALPARLCEHAKSTLRSITTVLTPYISQLEGGGEFDKIRRIYIDASRYVLWLILPVQVGFWLLGGYFFALWIGPEHAKHCHPVLIVLATPLALALSQSIAGRVLYGIGELKFFSRLVLLEATANLLLSIILIRPFGIIGVAVGTALPTILMNIALIVHVCGKLKLPLRTYLRQSLLAPWMAAIPSGICWAVLIAYMPIYNWFDFFFVGVLGAVCFLTPAFIYENGFKRWRSMLESSIVGDDSTTILRHQDNVADVQ